ncbi:hypothetical protein FOA52_013452 [Chlamydomonas sp. UWO 241]|nr:hypothetical protein FOA52_013452 [Chlamydomonas sp. UWO 241]
MDATVMALMPPPAPRHPLNQSDRVKEVLDEETYTSHIEAIIERDYFPDVPKMRSQLEWLQAVKSGDPARIRQAQINIAHRRVGLSTPLHGSTPAGTPRHTGMTGTPGGATPGTLGDATPSRPGASGTGWDTPTPLASGRGGGDTPAANAAAAAAALLSAAALRTPAMSPLVHGHGGGGGDTPGGCHGGGGGAPFDPVPGGTAAAAAALAAATGATARAPHVSLDAYLAAATSEDNASFARIVATDNACKRARVREAHYLSKDMPLLLGAGGHVTDGYGTGGQAPMTLQYNKYNPLNALYYKKDAVPLTQGEAAARAVGPPRVTIARNTRLPGGANGGSMFSSDTPSSIMAAAAAAALAGGSGGNGPSGGGGSSMGVLATPSFTPGRDGFSPLMTWGELGGTPLRLDAAGAPMIGMDIELDIPAGALSAGPFQVQELGKRELVGHTLAHKKSTAGGGRGSGASAVHGHKRGAGLALLAQHRRGPSPALSPAARALASKLQGGSTPLARAAAGGRDEGLRASYRAGTPSATPGAGGSRLASRGATPLGGEGTTPAAGATPGGVGRA